MLRAVLYGLTLVLGVVLQQARAATYLVSNPNDSGAGSLRQAILDANSNSGQDTISFWAPIAQPIYLSSSLPPLSDSSGAIVQGNAWVLDGSFLGGGAFGLVLQESNNTVDNLGVVNFSSVGVLVAAGTSNVITRCRIGTNFSDATGMGNGVGVFVDSAVTGTLTIGGSSGTDGNVISGNLFSGIQNESSGTVFVFGNKIGTDAAGAVALGNATFGVYLLQGVGGFTQLGDSDPNERNIISGNTGGAGVSIESTGGTVSLFNNYIGLNATGNAALPNDYGVSIEAANQADVTIGWPSATDRNVIAGNTSINVHVEGEGNVDITGNTVGLNLAGTTALGSTNLGLDLKPGNGATVTVGGNTSAHRNVISGHSSGGSSAGIYVDSPSSSAAVIIQGNFIGVNAAGTAGVGNRNGVFSTEFNQAAITLGGSTAAQGNVLSGNLNSGAVLKGHGNMTVRHNLFGLDPAGTAAMANFDSGLALNPEGTSTVNVLDNTLSGHNFGTAAGMIVAALSSTPVITIHRNRFGTNAAGSATLNSHNGVSVDAANLAPISFGDSPANGNILRGHSHDVSTSLPVRIDGTGNVAMIGNNFQQNDSFANIFLNGAANEGVTPPLITQVTYVDSTNFVVSGSVDAAGTVHWYRVDDTGGGITGHAGGAGGAVELVGTQAVAAGAFNSLTFSFTTGTLLTATLTTAGGATSAFATNRSRPLAQAVTVADGGGADIDLQTTQTYSMSWSLVGPTNVPVGDQRVMLGTTPGGAEILSASSVGAVATTYVHPTPIPPSTQVYGTVRVLNGLGEVALEGNTDGVVVDVPYGGDLFYVNGPVNSSSVAISLQSAESYSGITQAEVQRRSAGFANGVCGGFSGFSFLASVSPAAPFYNDNTVATGNCYEYRYVVTNSNSAQLIITTPETAKVDNVFPAGGSIAYPDGIVTGTSVSITLGAGTDAHSGITSVQLERQSAPLSGVCGSYGSFVNVGSQTPGTTQFSDSAVSNDTCYRYQYRVVDGAGNETVYTSSNAAIVVPSGPYGGSVSYSDSFLATTPVDVILDQGTSSAGILSVQLQRQEATLGNGVCGGYGGFFDQGSQSPGTTGYSDSAAVSGKCYKYRYVVTDNNTDTAFYTSAAQARIDTGVPAGGNVNYTSGSVSSSPLNVTYSDGGSFSGIASIQLERAAATLTGGACGGFSAFAAIGAQAPGSGFFPDNTIASGNCYMYRLKATNGAGSTTTYTSSAVAKVSLGGPNGGSIGYTDGFLSASSVLLALDEGTSAVGMKTVQVQRAGAVLSNGVCGGFGAFGNLGSQSPGATQYNDATLVSGNCYKYQYRVTDNADVVAVYTTPSVVKVDTTVPAGGSAGHVNGDWTSTSLTVTLNQGSASSGIASVQLQRSTATLTAGVCGGFGGYANTGSQSPGAVQFVDTVAGDTCYRYQYVVTSAVGLQATFQSGQITKVVTDGPQGGSVGYTNGTISTTTVAVSINPGTSPSGIASVQLERAAATLSDGLCGSFGGFTNAGTQQPTDTSYNDASVASGQCYQYRFRVQDNALHVVTYTSPNVVKIDAVAPAGGSITYANGDLGVLPVAITLDEGAAASGMAAVQLERASATLTGGVCGTFGAFGAVGSQVPGTTSYNDATAQNITCYQYRYRVTGTSGLSTTYTSPNVVKVNVSGPGGGSVSYPNGVINTTTQLITVSEGSAPSGIASVQLERALANYSNNLCGSFGGFFAQGSQSPGTTQVNDTTVQTGFCYQYRYRVTDHLATTVTYTSSAILKVDAVAPAGGSIGYTNGDLATDQHTVNIAAGTAVSTIASVQLERASAVLTLGVCGGFGGFTAVGTQQPTDTLFVDTVAGDTCYKYQYRVTSVSGLQTLYTSPSVTKVVLDGPTGGGIGYTNGFSNATPVALTLAAGTAPTGISSSQVQRAAATLSGGVCGSFGGYASVGTQLPTDTSYNDATAATGNCYRYQYVVTDNASHAVVFGNANTVKLDTAQPAGGSIAYPNGTVTLLPVTLTLAAGTAASGIGSVQVERKQAVLSGGICGTFGAFAALGTQQSADATYNDTSAASNTCYQYRYVVTSAAGNTATYTSPNVAKVNVPGPSGGSVTYSNGFTTGAGHMVLLNEGTSPVGMASVQLQRAQASLSGGVCGGFGAFSNLGSQSVGATSFNDASLVSGNCYQYRYRVTDNDLLSVTYTSGNVLKVDQAPPGGGFVSYLDGDLTITANLVTFSPGSAASGIASVQLERATAALTAGVCGGFGPFGSVGSQTPLDTQFVDTVSGDTCYRYRFVVTSTAGLNTTYSSPAVTQVVTDGPQGGSVTHATGIVTAANLMVTLSAGQSPAGIQGIQLERAEATYSNGTCGGFGPYGGVGTQQPTDTSYNDTSQQSGKCYQYQLTVTDNALRVVTYTGPGVARVDRNPPAGGFITSPNGEISALPVALTFYEGTAASGISGLQVERAQAVYSGGVCGGFGGFTPVGSQVPGGGSYNDTGAQNNTCYHYRLVAVSGAGLAATYTNASVTKVALVGPQGGSVSYANGLIATTAATITLNQGTSPAGIASVQLERASAVLAAGSCSGFGAFSPVGAQSPGAGTYNDASLATGNCYKYQYRVTDNNTDTTVYTSVSILKVDAAPPAGGSVSYTNGTVTSVPIVVGLGQGSAASGIGSVQMERAQAALGGGLCGTFGSFTAVGSQPPGATQYFDGNAVDATCYQYRYRVTSNAGLSTTFTSAAVAKVELSGPQGGFISYTDGPTSVASMALSLAQGTSPAGIVSVQLQRATATLSGGACGTFGAFLNLGTQSPGTTSYDDATAASGTCVKYRYRVTDGNSDVTDYVSPSVAKVDRVAPAGGNLSYPDGPATALPIAVTFQQGTAVSGITAVQLERAEAPLSGGVCGTFGAHAAVGVQSPGATGHDDAMAPDDSCLRYRYVVTGGSGLVSTYTSAAITRLTIEGPQGGFVDYADGFYGASSLTVQVAQGTSPDGIVSVQLERASSTLAGGVCGGFGGFLPVGSQTVGTTTVNDTGLLSGQCYRYQYRVTDGGAKTTLYQSAAVTRVDYQAPTGGSIGYASGTVGSLPLLVSVNEGTAASGVISVQLERSQGTQVSGNCTGYGAFAAVGSLSPGTTGYGDAALSTGFCYKYRYVAQNATGFVSTYTSAAEAKVTLTGPQGGSVSYADGFTSQTSLTVTYDQGASGSGINAVQLQRASAPLSGGVCGAFGAFANLGSQTVGSTSHVDNNTTTGACYQYRLQVTDGASNTNIFGSLAVVKVDRDNPAGGSVAYADGNVSGLPVLVSLNPGVAVSGLVSVQLMRAEATLSGGVCGTFGAYAPVGSQSAPDTFHEDFSPQTGRCYRYRYDVQSAVGLSAQYTSAAVAKVTLSGPQGGSLTYTNGFWNVLPVPVTFSPGQSPDGITSVQLQRATAALTQGACGGFGSYSNLGTQTPQSTSHNDTTLASGQCAQYQLRATDGAAKTTVYTSQAVVKLDNTPPTGLWLSAPQGTVTVLPIALLVGQGTAASGVASLEVLRAEATLTGQACGTFGSFASLVVLPPGTTGYNDNTALGGKCYRYRLRVASQAGLSATADGPGETKVAVSGAQGGAISYTGGLLTSTGLSIFLNQGSSAAGISSVQLERAEAAFEEGQCATMGAFVAQGIQTVGATSYFDGSVQTGQCYQYRYRVTDGAAQVTLYTSANVVQVDAVAPQGALLGYPDGNVGTAPLMVTFNAGSAASGITGVELLRRTAPLTVGVCGAFSAYTMVAQPSVLQTAFADNTVVSDTCYQYKLVLTSAAGWTTTLTGQATSKVMLQGPQGGHLTVAGEQAGFRSGTAVALTMNPGVVLPSGTVVTAQLRRATAVLTDGVCGAFGAFAPLGATTPQTTSYNDTVTHGQCAKYQYHVTDGSGRTTVYANTAVVKVDTQGPVGSGLSYTGGELAVLPMTVMVTAGTAASGIDAMVLERAQATLTGGVCGAFGVYATLAVLSPQVMDHADNTVLSGRCYRYRLKVTAGVGATMTFGPGPDVKVTASGPQGGGLSYADGFLGTAKVTVSLNPGGSTAAITAVTLDRAKAPLVAGVCGTFGAYATLAGTFTPTTTSFTDTTLAHGNCYKYRYKVTDADQATTTYTSFAVTRVDLLAPIGTKLNYVGGEISQLPVVLTFSAGTAASGIGQLLLERTEADQGAGGVCGTFGDYGLLAVFSGTATAHDDHSAASGHCYRYRLRAVSRSGLQTTITPGVDVKPLLVGPQGTQVSYPNGFIQGTTVTVGLVPGAGPFPITQVQLHRRSAALLSGTCGAWSGLTTLGTQTLSQTSFDDTTLQHGKCYQYVYSVLDSKNNPGLGTSSAVLGVDTQAPQGVVVSYVSGTVEGQVQVGITQGTAASGIMSLRLMRATAARTTGSCGTFGAFVFLADIAPGTANYTDAPLPATTCFKYKVTATSGTGVATTYESQVVTFTPAPGDPPPATNSCAANCVKTTLVRASVPKGPAPDPYTLGLVVDIRVGNASVLKEAGVPIVSSQPSFAVDPAKIPQGTTTLDVVITNPPAGFLAKEGMIHCGTVPYPFSTTPTASCSLLLPAEGGDANGDNKIDLKDLGVVKQEFKKTPVNADFNGDGKVDLKDLGIIKLNFKAATAQ